MPIYRYECLECGEEFTALTDMGRESEVRCRKCASSRLKRLLPRSFVGRTSEGKKITGSSCSTCTASSCSSCKG